MKTKVFLFCLLITFRAVSQEWELIKSLDFDQPITALSTDQNENIYIGGIRGVIRKFDSKGEFITDIELPTGNEITLIEASNPLKLFLFYGQNQEIAYFDRFVASAQTYPVNIYTDELTRIATIGMDHSIWILEEPQFILKKFNLPSQRPVLSIPLNNSIALQDVRQIKSHRDLFFLVDFVEGIYVLDQFGNLLSQHRYEGVQFIQIYKEKLVFLFKNTLFSIGIYSGNVESIAVPKGYARALISDEVCVLFKSSRMDIYRSIPR